MKSIQSKFIVLILAGILISIIVIGSAGVVSSKQAIDDDSVQIMNLMCGENAMELNNILSRIEQSVQIMSVYVTENLESIECLEDSAYLEEYTERLGKLALTIGNKTTGAVAIYVRYSTELAPTKSGVFLVKNEESKGFEEHELTDLGIYSPDDIEHVGWYYVPVNRGIPTWMQPYQNKNIDVYMISYVIPVYKGNELLGVVGMDIDFDYITDMVDRIQIYDTGYAFLVDEELNVIHHRSWQPGTSMLDFGDTLAMADTSFVTEDDRLYEYTWDGAGKKVAFRKLMNGMCLAVTAPVTEIDAAKNELVSQIVVAAVLLSAMFIVVTILITRTIVRPLKELNAAAKKVADGDLSVSLTCRSKDEVGRLTESLRQTVSQLKIRIDYINSLAFYDKLTGIKNNTAYLHEVNELKERMQNENVAFALAVADVNGLKQINDTYGHAVGNELIITTAKMITQVFEKEHVYRIGGDEFAVILEGADERKCQEYTRELLALAEASAGKMRVSLAVGTTVYDASLDNSYERVFRRADDEMYKKKLEMKARGEGSRVSESI